MSKLVRWIEHFDFPKKGVIHIGAHEAQEAAEYAQCKLEPVLWFEAIPALVKRARERLSQYPNQAVREGLLWSESGQEKDFNLA